MKEKNSRITTAYLIIYHTYDNKNTSARIIGGTLDQQKAFQWALSHYEDKIIILSSEKGKNIYTLHEDFIEICPTKIVDCR